MKTEPKFVELVRMLYLRLAPRGRAVTASDMSDAAEFLQREWCREQSEWFHCKACDAAVKVDEDGCCATCRHDTRQIPVFSDLHVATVQRLLQKHHFVEIEHGTLGNALEVWAETIAHEPSDRGGDRGGK